MLEITVALLVLAAGLALYVVRVNAVMLRTPSEAEAHAGKPLTAERIRRALGEVKESGIDWYDNLPPRKERRYVIVGGSGLVGGQLALHLLKMGVPPAAIRLLDMRPPVRSEFSCGAASEIAWLQVDITSESATMAAFAAPWHESVSGLPLTVFHTAAVIRAFERSPMLYERCSRPNVLGTANVLSAARRAGCGVLVYTSSCHAGARRGHWLFAPWTLRPRAPVQFIGEDDFFRPMMAAGEFAGNYARSKAEAERLACGADGGSGGSGGSGGRMRTGAIRPGNAVYGHREDKVLGWMLRLGRVPTFSGPWVQNWVNVRNVAQAHLLLEDALLGEHADKVAGRPYMVSDGGAPLRFQDVYDILAGGSATGFRVHHPPPALLLLLAYGVEAYCLLLARAPRLRRLLREPGMPWCLFQPATFSSACSSIMDDAAARRAPAEGGIGYRPSCTSLEGMCAQVADWNEWVGGAKGDRPTRPE